MATLEDAVRFDRELRPRALPALLGDFGLGHLAHKLQAADLDLPSAKLLQKHDLVELGIHGDADREAFLELLKTRDVGVVVWYREDRGIGFVRPLGTDFDDWLSNVFVARADIVRGAKSLRSGVFVSYVADAADGGPNAVARDLRTLGTQVPAQAFRDQGGGLALPVRGSELLAAVFLSKVRRSKGGGRAGAVEDGVCWFLGPETKAPAIKRHFERVVGKVVDCSVVPGKYYGFVTFETAQLAEKALGKHDVDGRLLTVKKDTRPRDPKGAERVYRAAREGVRGLHAAAAAAAAAEGRYRPAARERLGRPAAAAAATADFRTVRARRRRGAAGLRGSHRARRGRAVKQQRLERRHAARLGRGAGLRWCKGGGAAVARRRPGRRRARRRRRRAAGFFGNGLGGLNALAAAPAPPPGIAPTPVDSRSLQEKMQDAIKRQDREAIRALMAGRDIGEDEAEKKAQGGAGAARECFTGSGEPKEAPGGR